ncbi:hypothetical protein N9N41_06620 [Opitutales bacterium]|nr:hypothetical protein [Opitutales bacterium]
MAPGSKPLGSMKEKFFNLDRTEEDQSHAKKVESSDGKDAEASPDNSQGLPKLKVSNSLEPIREISGSNRNWVGPTPLQLVPHSIPLGSLKNLFDQTLNGHGSFYEEPDDRLNNSTQDPNKQALPVELGLFGSSRFYSTTNVLRTKEDEMKSEVWENTIGASLASKPIPAGKYITLVPKIDFIMQWANYNEESVSDLLNYRFGMVKGSLDIYLPQDFRVSPGFEYDFLHSQFSGGKLFDAVAPSLSVQKILGLNDSTFLLLDGMLKYSRTNRIITFPTDNIFPDDGDNLQLGLNLNFMKSFGEDGNFIIMPGIGLSRTEYLKNNQDGRVDILAFAGISGIWQPLEWFSLQAFYNFTTMTSNSIGKELLGKSSTFKARDLGCSITANHSF